VAAREGRIPFNRGAVLAMREAFSEDGSYMLTLSQKIIARRSLRNERRRNDR
jgi:hypothetical protein